MSPFLEKLRHHKSLTVSLFLFLFLTLPLLIYVLQQRQDIRQRASEQTSVINIQAKGTPCENTYPTLILKTDGTEIKRWENVGNVLQTYSYSGSLPSNINNIVIEFPNDCYQDTNEDRNLYIESIEFNSKKISGNTAGVINTASGTGENKKWLFTNGALIFPTQLFAESEAPVPVGISCTATPASDTILSMNMTSPSTDDSRLTPVKNAGKAYVDYLATNTQNYVGLVNYSSGLLTLTTNYTEVKQSIDWTPARTYTNNKLADALDLAFRVLITSTRTNVPKKVILFTADKQDPADNSRLITTAGYFQNGRDWQIYTIGLGSNIDENILQTIASTTKGKYYHVDQIDQLQDAYLSIEKGTISGSVFNDLNTNGIRDQGEPGEFNWPVHVYSTSSPNQVLEILKTDTNGNYSFKKFCAGQTYTLKPVQKPGWQQTLPANNEGYTVAVTKDSVNADKNFGFKVLPSPTPSPTITPTQTPQTGSVDVDVNIIGGTIPSGKYLKLLACDKGPNGPECGTATRDMKTINTSGTVILSNIPAGQTITDMRIAYYNQAGDQNLGTLPNWEQVFSVSNCPNAGQLTCTVDVPAGGKSLTKPRYTIDLSKTQVFSKIEPINTATVTYGSTKFSWTQHQNTMYQFYIIEYYNAAGVRVYQTSTPSLTQTETTIDLSTVVNPETSQRAFEAGKDYYWQVFANNGGSSQDVANNNEKWKFTILNGEPTRTPTVDPSHSVTLNINLYLHGLGNSGDNVSTQSALSNKNPNRKVRPAFVELLNNQGQVVTGNQGTITYASESGSFAGSVVVGIPSTTQTVNGPYTVRVKSDQYVTNRVAGIFSFDSGQSYTLPDTTLTTGDVINDNKLNILDYNVLYGCYTGSILTVARNCNETKKAAADLTDEGTVNQYDLNLFIRELSVQSGF